MFSWWNNAKLLIKLVAAFLGLTVGVGSIVGLTSYANMSRIHGIIDDIEFERTPLVEQAADVERAVQQTLLATHEFLISMYDVTLDRAELAQTLERDLEQTITTLNEMIVLAQKSNDRQLLDKATGAQLSISEYQKQFDQAQAALSAADGARAQMLALADSLTSDTLRYFQTQVVSSTIENRQALLDTGRVWQHITNTRVHALRYVASRDPVEIEQVEASIAQLDTLYDALLVGALTPDDRLQVERIRANTDQYAAAVQQFATQADTLAAAVEQMDTLAQQVRLRVAELQEAGWAQMQDDEHAVNALAESSLTTIIIVVNIAILLGALVGFLIARAIVRALDASIGFARRVAQGDLTARLDVKGKDELGMLGSSLNDMASSLADLSGQIGTGAHGMGAASAEILAAVSQHTASANEQLAAVSQTSATVNEVRAAAEQSAQRAEEVADLAQVSLHVGQDGSAAVEAILKSMVEIKAKVELIAQDILTLSQQTQQIGEITSTVNDLADQSNILALNAAIEAARAGEQGRGFAVVAAEVRNLADQSKQATAKVRTILGDIQKATHAAVMATEQGTRGVDAGMTLTQRAGEVIRQLGINIHDAAQAAQQIVASARQQSIAMDQIAQAIKEINQAAIQSVAGARQSQTAAEGLANLARDLQSSTSRFRLHN